MGDRVTRKPIEKSKITKESGRKANAPAKTRVERSVKENLPASDGLRYSAPALEKGLDIMEFLSERAKAYSLAQLAVEMGRTKGEIFRMLVVLEARGYVERTTEADEYQVTDKLLRIGLRRPQYRSLTEIARPFMERFAAETRYPCHLAIASDEQIVVIARAESPDLVGVTVRVGYRQPLLETGSGRCILAHLDEAPRQALIALLRRMGAKFDAAALEVDSDEIRTRGHVVEESRVMEGVWDISCPVSSQGQEEIVAALTTPYVRLVTNQVSKDVVAQKLKAAAAEISRKLNND